jgi:hypothetical protein
MPSSYARKLGQIIDDTLRLCGDYTGSRKNGELWTIHEVKDAINDIVYQLVLDTNILRDTRTIHIEADTYVYTLPADLLRLLRVSLHGTNGTIMFPKSTTEYDLVRGNRADSGDPTHFQTDLDLAYNQISFVPTPNTTGGETSRDSDYGLLRSISDGSDYLEYDDNRPLRRIRGLPFTRSGTGRIIREVISPYGNIQLTFVRVPAMMEDFDDDYPDPDIPDYVHKDIKYGAASLLLEGSKRGIDSLKLIRCQRKWGAVSAKLQRNSEHQGPMREVSPV